MLCNHFIHVHSTCKQIIFAIMLRVGMWKQFDHWKQIALQEKKFTIDI